MRRVALTFAVLIVLPCAGLAQEPASDALPGLPLRERLRPIEVTHEEIYLPQAPEYVVERSDRKEQRWRELHEKLNRVVTLPAEPISCRKAIELLGKQLDEQILFAEDFELAGIAIDDVIETTVDGQSAEEAFRTILKDFALELVVDGESLVVATEAGAEDMFTTRIYPVADLVVSQTGDRIEAHFEPLIDVIQRTTYAPWRDIDNVGGSVVPFAHGGVLALVIRQQYRAHRDIELLLHNLRRVRSPAFLDGSARTVRRTIEQSPEAAPGEPLGHGSGIRSRELSPEVRERLDALRANFDKFSPALRERIRALESDAARETPTVRERAEELKRRSTNEPEAPAAESNDNETTVIVPIPGRAVPPQP